jgi:hypothetical protein
MTAPKRLALTGLLVVIGLTAALGSAELALRLMGRQPFRYLGVQSREPTMYDTDPEFGWIPKPGAYVVPAYSQGAPDIPFTLLEDGTRATSRDNPRGKDGVAFVGCSLTLGWAIADDETFAWRLQERFPSVHVLNYGRGAYGTYQSLQTMERMLDAPDPPRLVLYGFMEEHESRNVAAAEWLLALDLFSKKGMVSTPYCTLDSHGELVRQAPIHYPHFPLRSVSALAAFVEERYATLSGAARGAQARPVTEQLMIEMNRLAQRHGVRFAVVLLHASPPAAKHYREFLKAHDIDVVDCTFPIRSDMQVAGEGHPNGIANARWAHCMEGFIGDAIGVPLQTGRHSGRHSRIDS